MRSTGEVVIIKLVHRDEFAIHAFLSGLKAPRNHTIPILDTISLGVANFIVLGNAQVYKMCLTLFLEPWAIRFHSSSWKEFDSFMNTK